MKGIARSIRPFCHATCTQTDVRATQQAFHQAT